MGAVNSRSGLNRGVNQRLTRPRTRRSERVGDSGGRRRALRRRGSFVGRPRSDQNDRVGEDFAKSHHSSNPVSLLRRLQERTRRD